MYVQYTISYIYLYIVTKYFVVFTLFFKIFYTYKFLGHMSCFGIVICIYDTFYKKVQKYIMCKDKEVEMVKYSLKAF